MVFATSFFAAGLVVARVIEIHGASTFQDRPAAERLPLVLGAVGVVLADIVVQLGVFRVALTGAAVRGGITTAATAAADGGGGRGTPRRGPGRQGGKHDARRGPVVLGPVLVVILVVTTTTITIQKGRRGDEGPVAVVETPVVPPRADGVGVGGSVLPGLALAVVRVAVVEKVQVAGAAQDGHLEGGPVELVAAAPAANHARLRARAAVGPREPDGPVAEARRRQGVGGGT